MRRRKVRWLLWMLALVLSGREVQAAPDPPPAAGAAGWLNQQPTQEMSLSVDDVIRMVKGGVSEEIIVARLRQQGKPLQLTAEEIVLLKKAQVSDSVIRVMMDPQADIGLTGRVPPLPAPIKSMAQGSAADLDLLRWRQSYEAAKSKRSSGLAMEIVGIGVAGSSLYFYLTMNQRIVDFGRLYVVDVRVRDNRRWAAALATSAGGAVFSMIGGFRRSAGTREVRELEEEGRSKNYMVLGPSPAGTGVMVAYRF